MKSYPVSVHRMSYRGSDKRKVAQMLNYQRVADKIETYLNQELAALPDDTVQVFMSWAVASAIGEDDELVRKIILATDGGSGGITICKGDFERAMAKRNSPPSPS
jgi:hypothetical protein